jgi:hypothetical protein
MRNDWTFVWFAIRLRLTLAQYLKSSSPNIWQCCPRGRARSGTVEVHREAEVCGECASKCSSDHNCAALTPVWPERHNWDYINRPDSWVHPATRTTFLRRREINGCHGKPRERTCGKGEGLAVANIGVDASIVIGVVMHI